MIRAAVLEDLDALIALETSCFPGDRLSVRQFRRFIKSDNSRTLIIEQQGVEIVIHGPNLGGLSHGFTSWVR